MTQLVTLLFDSKLVSVLCHFANFGCGDGGWTPVMKMDGNKVKDVYFFPQFDNQSGKKNVSQINTGLLLSAVILNYSSLRL